MEKEKTRLLVSSIHVGDQVSSCHQLRKENCRGHRVYSLLTLLENVKLFSKVLVLIYIHTSSVYLFHLLEEMSS